MHLKTSFFLSVILGFLVFSSASGAGVVGESAPDFSLEDFDGNTHTLSDFRDKTVVLLFMLGFL